MGGGGASDLKLVIEEAATKTLAEELVSMGFMAITGEDDAFVAPERFWKRICMPSRPFGVGDGIRDWSIVTEDSIAFVYDGESRTLPAEPLHKLGRFAETLWVLRSSLKHRLMFGKYPEQSGLSWWEYRFFAKERYACPVLVFAFVATHNQFTLHSGGSIFKQSAPVIKFRPEMTEDYLIGLVGLLNSSVACAWMKQTFHNKGGGGIGGGLATEEWEQFYEFDGTKLKKFPIPAANVTPMARELLRLASDRAHCLPRALAEERTPKEISFSVARQRATEILHKMISLQEELDWQCYRAYGLISEDIYLKAEEAPAITLGQRAFEIVMARRMANGDLDTTWFVRHAHSPITELPPDWPAEYRRLVERRISLIESDRNISLSEQPEYKRRWNVESWGDLERRALREWLLSRMEESSLWSSLELISCAKLADCLRDDGDFRQVAEMYRGRPDFDWTTLITELVEAESVPLLSLLRYTDSGLRKRAVWERTWELQRREDRLDETIQVEVSISSSLKTDLTKKRKAEEIGDIDAPPRYDSKDFQRQSYWSMRGRLDVPKERFVSFPFCQRDADQTPVIGWAGWNDLQQAQAIAAYYERVKNQEGWTPERRVLLLTGILELIPWLKQWHNAVHPDYKERMGNFFQQFVEDEARAMEMTTDQIRGWTPPVQSSSRGRKKRNT